MFQPVLVYAQMHARAFHPIFGYKNVIEMKSILSIPEMMISMSGLVPMTTIVMFGMVCAQ